MSSGATRLCITQCRMPAHLPHDRPSLQWPRQQHDSGCGNVLLPCPPYFFGQTKKFCFMAGGTEFHFHWIVTIQFLFPLNSTHFCFLIFWTITFDRSYFTPFFSLLSAVKYSSSNILSDELFLAIVILACHSFAHITQCGPHPLHHLGTLNPCTGITPPLTNASSFLLHSLCPYLNQARWKNRSIFH